MKLKGSAIVVETLIAHGVTDVFGFPGGAVLNLYDELYKYSDRINHYITAHEQGASHAADGYARATGKPGVVIATSGPGATNLVTGLATAYLDSSPVVAITGNVALPLIGKDSFQEVDITGITMPVTKHNYIVKDVRDLEPTIREAFRIAMSGRPGPVLIDIPKDIQDAECEYAGEPLDPLFPRETASDASLREAVKLIDAANKPYIYAGGGVVTAGAYEALERFAERIDAPVGFSMMGLSAMDYRSPRKLGMTGMHGVYASSKMNAEADLIIGVGVRFSDRATGNKAKYEGGKSIIHIDLDAAELSKNIGCTVEVMGDIADALPRLTAMVKRAVRPEWAARAEFHRTEQRELDASQASEFTPRNIIRAVREYTADDTIIATDVGQHQMWTAQYYDFAKPRTFLTSGGLGTMGFGLGAALGASVARGGERTILFTGDGSFHMNLNEFATAVMHNLPVTVIVFNNNVLGMVRQWQGLFYGKRYSQTTMNRATNYQKLAEAFGGEGYRAENIEELQSALDKVFGGNTPAIIECLIDPDEKVLPMIPAGGSFDDMIVR
ncbi:acetolactate synthase [Clostridia bacterium]|nr:acetolactate synthase [Clostridia bacterium]